MNLTTQQGLQIALRHHQAGKLPEAEQMYRQVLEIDPANFEAHGSLGNVLRDLGQLEEAERSCRRALALGPEIAELHANLGTMLLDIRRVDESKRCYEQALRLKPDLVGAHYSLDTKLMVMTLFLRTTTREKDFPRTTGAKEEARTIEWAFC